MFVKRLSILVAIYLVGTGIGHAQQAPTVDPTAQKPLSEQEQKQALEKAKQQREKENARKTKPPKEVFKPTEEISEDSPVPFPVDI